MSAAPNFNAELVNCLENLREQREQLNRKILADEKCKAELEQQIRHFTERLHQTNEQIAVATSNRDDFDVAIRESEAAYMKILESSQTLLHVLKREAVSLSNNASAGK